MKKEFEDYLEDNRDHFEQGGPSPDLRAKLETALIQQRRKARIVFIRRLTWSAAAACILLAAGLIWWPKKQADLPDTTSQQVPARPVPIDTSHQRDKARLDAYLPNGKAGPEIEKPETDGIQKSLFHYTRSIELREEKLLPLRSSDPDLYMRSKKALQDLKQVYVQLKEQLAITPDKRQVEELLLQNLQLQQQILDNQIQLLLPNNKTEVHGKQIQNI